MKSTFLISICLIVSSSIQGVTLDQAYFQLAQLLQEANNTQEALVYLEKTIAHNPEHAHALYQLGMYYYAHNDLERSYSYLERACKLDFHNAQAFIHAGTCAITLHHVDQAIDYFHQAIALDPQSPKTHFLLGHAYAKKQNLSAAIKEFSISLQLSPHSIDIHMSLAHVLRENHQVDASLELYDKALAIDPLNQKIILEKAHALAMRGDNAQAGELYQELYKKNGSSQVVLYNLAHVYKKMGHYDQAIALYQKILKESPNLHQAHLAIAQTYLYMHNYYDGFQELARSIKNHITEKPMLTQLSDAKNKTILITAVWNQEDMIHLARFIPILKEYAAQIFLVVDNQLAPLLKLCPWIDQVISADDAHVPYFDAHISMLALPALCIAKHHELPPWAPYVIAPSSLADQWRTRMHIQTGHLSVGIYWKSNEQSDNKAEDKNISFCAFEQLMQTQNIHCYALQTPSLEELNQINYHGMITLLNKNISPRKKYRIILLINKRVRYYCYL